MKKKFLLVMFALLSVSLLFFACSSSDDDDPPPPADNPTPPALSTDADLISVYGAAITLGGEAGTEADPITGTVTVPNLTTTVAAANFEASDDATVTVYTGDFTTAAGSVTLTPDDDTDVYVLVTAEDGTTKLYYKITVTEPPPSTAADLLSVFGEPIAGWGSETGAKIDPITGSVTVPDGTLQVADGDFTFSAGATVTVYTTTNFDGLAGPAGITPDSNTTVYVLVTAEDTTTKKYYSLTVTEPALVGAVSAVNETTAGEDEVAAIAAVYEITITSAITTDEDTLTFTHVAESGPIVYTYDDAGGDQNTAAEQAALAAAAINADGTAFYIASSNGAVITLTAKTAGVISDDPEAAVSNTGGVSVGGANPAGADLVAAIPAVYTVTISTPIETGEKIVFANVATSDVVYVFVGGTTTAEDQATAAAAAINAAAGAKYNATTATDTITLTAIDGGEISDDPTAEVAFQ